VGKERLNHFLASQILVEQSWEKTRKTHGKYRAGSHTNGHVK
jgi:hypothetical protein